MMPTQWAKDPTMTDDLLGWTKEKFETIVPGATYHAASSAAATIFAAKLIKKVNNCTSNCTFGEAADEVVPFDTFYGTINFNDDGSIKDKPMYILQKQGTENVVVFPKPKSGEKTAKFLETCDHWETSMTDIGERVLPAGFVAVTVVFAYFANIMSTGLV